MRGPSGGAGPPQAAEGVRFVVVVARMIVETPGAFFGYVWSWYNIWLLKGPPFIFFSFYDLDTDTFLPTLEKSVLSGIIQACQRGKHLR